MVENLDADVPFQSVDEILAIRRGVNFYLYLIGRFASFSGISGVRPNFLVRDQNGFSTEPTVKRQLSASFRSPTHIVKFWDESDFPQLAANEFFCLNVAEECGLEVPPHRLTKPKMAARSLWNCSVCGSMALIEALKISVF